MTSAIELGINDPSAAGTRVQFTIEALDDGRMIHGCHETNTPTDLAPLLWEVIDVNHTIFSAAPVVHNRRGEEQVLSHQKRFFSKDANILVPPQPEGDLRTKP